MQSFCVVFFSGSKGKMETPVHTNCLVIFRNCCHCGSLATASSYTRHVRGKNLSFLCRFSLRNTCQFCFSFSLFKFDKWSYFSFLKIFLSYSDVFPLEIKPSSEAINHRSRWGAAGYTCLVGPRQRATTVAPPLTLPGLPAYGRCALWYVMRVAFQTEMVFLLLCLFLLPDLSFVWMTPPPTHTQHIVTICPSALGITLQCIICNVSFYLVI